ncbi:DnaD domain-containing protein [Bacillus subtilis]|uniref:DnaD domain-containing protein n=1 Tax=Bacillus TaxID=1386 RepID=UPI000772B201|nr:MULTISPECIES: DnaD domain protein [Bacillus subtilis group]KAF1341678.1 putative DNA-binding protein skin element [Bacillus subtilis]KXJ32618.1 DNA-binding protein [Bacillus spizizenii]
MNYLKEMNGFMNWLETNPLSATTQALWFHLLHINNKAGWREWFTTSNTTLQAKIEISENTLIKHRKMLIDLKRIEYKPQGRKAGQYRMISFETPVTEQEPSEKPVPEPTPAQKKQQEDEKKMKSNAFAFFEDEGFGLLSSFMAEKLNSLIDDYGEDKVLEAMKEAVTRNARNLAYVQRILQSNKNKSKEWQHGNTQNAKYGRGNGSNTEKASGKVSPIFGGVGRVRRKG